MDDAVRIPLEAGPDLTWGFLPLSAAALCGQCTPGRKHDPFKRFPFFSRTGHFLTSGKAASEIDTYTLHLHIYALFLIFPPESPSFF
jgi:hypothetical protein